ncbi:MAG: helix-turn-helix domain-containing protein [Acidimicrobiia bacterium]
MSPTANIQPRIGAAIRSRRKALGLTQQDVADLSGIQRQTVGRLEADHPEISLQIAVSVADAVGLELSASIPEHDAE